jgi:FhuF 2Fe-2S C-terminal domain
VTAAGTLPGGPYFAVDRHDPAVAPDAGWHPLSELLDRPAVLRSRVEAARARLAAGGGVPADAVELRVAASVVHLGVAARVVSPLLALAAVSGVDRVPAPADVRWRDLLGGAFPLSLPATLLDRPPAAAPDWCRWADGVTDGLAALGEAFAALTPSPHVRRGNVASAVHGAVSVLTAAPAGDLGAAERARARALGRLLLDRSPLRAAATGEPGRPAFRRRSCCLYYRIGRPAGPATDRAVCGDCVLAPG